MIELRRLRGGGGGRSWAPRLRVRIFRWRPRPSSWSVFGWRAFAATCGGVVDGERAVGPSCGGRKHCPFPIRPQGDHGRQDPRREGVEVSGELRLVANVHCASVAQFIDVAFPHAGDGDSARRHDADEACHRQEWGAGPGHPQESEGDLPAPRQRQRAGLAPFYETFLESL